MCSVTNCKSIKRFKPDGISFFKFPKNPRTRKIWVDILEKGRNWTWTKNKFVCSKHFVPEDCVKRSERTLLKANAVPSLQIDKLSRQMVVTLTNNIASEIDLFSSDSSKQLTPNQRKYSSENIKCEISYSNGSSGDKATVDLIHNYSVSPAKLLEQNIQLRKELKLSRLKLYYAKKIKRLKNEVLSLKKVITDLKRRKVNSNNVTEIEKRFEKVRQILLSRRLSAGIQYKALNHFFFYINLLRIINKLMESGSTK